MIIDNINNKYFVNQFNIDDNMDLEIILNKIREYFRIIGEQLRKGLITEKEFYIQTSFNSDLYYFWNKKGIKVKTKMLLDESFFESWDEWKTLGQLKTIKKWMYDALENTDDYIRDADWIMKVIDTLKIPFGLFKPLANKNTNVEAINAYSTRGRTKGGECIDTFIITEKCMDIEQLLECNNPINKEFIFNTENKNKVLIKIDRHDNTHQTYSGIGIIENYIVMPMRIDIKKNDLDNHWCFSFERIMDPLQYELVSVLTIPHPKWINYNKAVLRRNYEIECEYKTLRIPYLLGEDKEPVMEEEIEIGKTNEINGELSAYSERAEEGDLDAQYKLASIYSTGRNEVGVNKQKAFKLYSCAAEGGHLWAQYYLAWAYKRGDGVEEDPGKAFYWFEKAAEGGNVYAISNLADCYRKGYGIQKDYLKAFEWLKKADESSVCCMQLGELYELGDGIEKDLIKALYYYNKALILGGCGNSPQKGIDRVENKIEKGKRI